MKWQQMIRPFFAGVGSLILVAGLLLIPRQAFSPASAQTPLDDPMRRTITVNGSGSSSVQPDIAYIMLGVQTEAPTAREALTQNSQQMQAVTRALQAAGIASVDIQTSMIQLYPLYEEIGFPEPDSGAGQQPRTPQVRGYTAINAVQVTVRNVSNLGDVIDQVVDAGGNRIESIRFDVANRTQALTEARSAAFENARQKAEELAGLSKTELGEVISIAESSYFPIAFQSAGREMALDAASVPISPGAQSVTIDLIVTWTME